MAELKPYPKIPARGASGAPGSREWIATEKVHGAHFAVVCDGASVRPAKRRDLLGDEELDAFFGVSRIWPQLLVAAGRFAAVVRARWGESAVVTVYGELAGGRYPHPDVPAVAGVEPVQTGVWYAPGLRWLPFDATVRTDEGRWWVPDRELRAAASAAGLTCVPLLGRGSLNALRELPVAFPSRVPALLGLPEPADNLAEGYVLKPAGEWRESDPARPLIKVKQKAFAEANGTTAPARTSHRRKARRASPPGCSSRPRRCSPPPVRRPPSASSGRVRPRMRWRRRSPRMWPRNSPRPWAGWSTPSCRPCAWPSNPEPDPSPPSTQRTGATPDRLATAAAFVSRAELHCAADRFESARAYPEEPTRVEPPVGPPAEAVLRHLRAHIG
ncbi:RNA ligase family protein [Kitasatospora cathayae]|uniref:RNA ligase domain-containing protein n=1 Tax=Kitasatospora cathayae TaxID=3004092 RepID=A0ABY7Q1X9_9ACTN|nr:RNA ligase family protein [Kitasatospora sp. HUAS 3-15]WBP86636.1 hypothetical protein O1G21_12805 [Kitasatospora sp. HUAS 3-15]